MKPKSQSPYSKMYLIPPNMYEKLLICLDEKEKRVTEDLNVEENVEERPSEKEIEILNQEALNPEPEVTENPETEEMTEGAEEEREPEEVVGEQDEPEVVEDEMSLAEARRQKNRQINARLNLSKVSTSKTCAICFKVFARKWDLNRHVSTVHKNLIEKSDPSKWSQKPDLILSEENIPAQLNVSSVLPDDDSEMEMKQVIQPKTQKKSCPISADTTERVIPELYFKPPRKTIIVPQIKKQMMLVPQISKKKKVFLKPSIFKHRAVLPLKAKDATSIKSTLPMKSRRSIRRSSIQPDNPPQTIETAEGEDFEDWEEAKKRGSRSSSEAKLREKPPKWKKTEFPKWAE